MPRIIRLLLLGNLLASLLLAGVSPVYAHDEGPLNSLTVRTGKYPLIVEYYTNPHGGQALLFAIRPAEPVDGELHFTATAVPGTTVNAVPVKAELEPDTHEPNAVRGRVNLPVSGEWLLNIDVEGPLGTSSGSAPILAEASQAIPVWLGWLIGLIPVGAMTGWSACRPSGSAAGCTLLHMDRHRRRITGVSRFALVWRVPNCVALPVFQPRFCLAMLGKMGVPTTNGLTLETLNTLD